MCVIVYKPIGKKLPNEDTLKKCFEQNPDGAGYMLPINDTVVIHKGFATFESLKKDLQKVFFKNKLDIENTPLVLHFRISTQGGRKAGLCHPYPICRNYDQMRELETTCSMGLCHNGIISRCSTSEYLGGYWDDKIKHWVRGEKREVNYNDTMTFIKDYASLIIDNDQYFAKNDAKCELLERTCDFTKLAIMNAKGYVKLIGDFTERNGIYYSNTYFDVKQEVTPTNYKTMRDFNNEDDYYAYLAGEDF